MLSLLLQKRGAIVGSFLLQLHLQGLGECRSGVVWLFLAPQLDLAGVQLVLELLKLLCMCLLGLRQQGLGSLPFGGSCLLSLPQLLCLLLLLQPHLLQLLPNLFQLGVGIMGPLVCHGLCLGLSPSPFFLCLGGLLSLCFLSLCILY